MAGIAPFNVRIAGRGYPCRLDLMGTALRFKRAAGREINEVDMNSASDVFTLIWAGTATACRAAGIKFPYSTVDDLADAVEMETFEEWGREIAAATAAQGGDGDEKKTDGPSRSSTASESPSAG